MKSTRGEEEGGEREREIQSYERKMSVRERDDEGRFRKEVEKGRRKGRREARGNGRSGQTEEGEAWKGVGRGAERESRGGSEIPV